MPDLIWYQWVIGAISAYMIGVAKTGMPGLGILVVPMMVLAVGDARQSAGWLLPILCFADIVAVVYWRRHTVAARLFSLAPWVLGGMVAGAYALSMNERVLRPIIGAIIFAMLSVYLWRRFRLGAGGEPGHGPTYGLTAGFATTVANAAGPVMNLYLLSKRLPKEEFVATGAWFFFIINALKLPIYFWHGLISPRSLAFDCFVAPAVLGGALSGRWLLHRVPPRIFEAMVIALTAISTFLLFR
jgi:uncharacterized protein